MLKLFRYFFVILLIASGLTLGQSGVLKKDISKQITNPNFDGPVSLTTNNGKTVFSVTNPVNGDVIAQTDYDLFSNSVIRKQIAYYDNTVHFAPMIRGHLSTATRRVVTYIYNNGTNYVQVPVFDTTANSGWPHIDVSNTGQFAGTVAIVGHTPNRLALWDASSSTFTVSDAFQPNTDPSVQWSGDNIFLATSGNRLIFDFWKTTDVGSSFTKFADITNYHPTPIYWKENGGVEVGMAKSPNEQNLLFFGTNVGSGHVYDDDTVTRANSDNVWLVKSTDAGATFTGMSIGWDGDLTLLDYKFNQLVDTVTYTVGANQYTVILNQQVEFTHAPLFENFGQVEMVIDNNGVVHAVANGYGLAFANVVVTRPDGSGVKDTVLINANSAVFPVLYWNSVSNKWKAISDPAVDQLSDVIMADKRPLNGIGQSFPSISICPDGTHLYAIWTGPEIIDGQINIDASSDKFYTDLFHAYSIDGGTTWTYGGTLVNTPNKGDIYGHAAEFLQEDGNSYTAHILYLEDQISGSAIQSQGALSQNPLMYKKYTFVASGVEGNDIVVNNFELGQNYPNPFNPVTNIKYSVPVSGNVVLKVYDVLGREVATLLNSVQEAGSHSINFDASALSSGMYIYTLTTGNYTASKKMMLMK